MKKILIIILIILLGILAYYAMFKGLNIFNIDILSVKQIADRNEELTTEIENTNDLINTQYPQKATELRKSIQELLERKQEYLDLANLSSDSEIQQANQQQTYSIEYLWTRIGNHATAEGVNLKLEFSQGDTGGAEAKNLNFTLNGSYIAIINFIYAIENDSELGFRIENLKLVQGGEAKGNATGLQATFLVRNIGVKIESTTATVPTENLTTD